MAAAEWHSHQVMSTAGHLWAPVAVSRRSVMILTTMFLQLLFALHAAASLHRQQQQEKLERVSHAVLPASALPSQEHVAAAAQSIRRDLPEAGGWHLPLVCMAETWTASCKSRDACDSM
jgi:hypothetical protein